MNGLVYARSFKAAYKLSRKAARKAVAERDFRAVVCYQAKPRKRSQRNMHYAVVDLFNFFFCRGDNQIFKSVYIRGVCLN